MRAAKLSPRGRIMTGPKRVVAQLERLLDTQPSNRTRQGLIQQLAAQVNESRAVTGQKPLVACGAEGIDLHSLHIDFERACGLAPVDDQSVGAFYFAGRRWIEAKAV